MRDTVDSDRIPAEVGRDDQVDAPCVLPWGPHPWPSIGTTPATRPWHVSSSEFDNKRKEES
jgi:hypothetical protein